ncbi:MAG: cysteine--tRNA ligase [Gemmatimonadota bacterium]
MAIRFYNTLQRAQEPFEPLRPGRVGIYACGPTVYQLPHIGNYRTFLFNDLLHRWLEWKGFEVRMVMNVTDVDDRIIDLAAERGVSIGEYTAPHADGFFAELDTLGARDADAYPRATDHIPDMVALVEKLVERGHAYVADGSVYYDIGSFEGYGKLSRIPLDDVRVGERVASDSYEKQDARDFALWKAAKDSDRAVGAAWPSPWGEGRPGWHLECSAMSMAELGTTLDIHTGGEDLVFPHHEDEIAQSEGATGQPFVRTWMHAKHLLLDTEKMSKSVGNVVGLADVLEAGFHPAAIRYLLLSAHYRNELSFSYDGLSDASAALRRALDFRDRLRGLAGDASGDEIAAPLAPTTDEERTGFLSLGDADAEDLAGAAAAFIRDFEAALEDDLNTPAALGALFTFVRRANAELDRGRQEGAAAGLAALAAFDQVFGVFELADRGAGVDPDVAAWADERLEARQRARAQRDWAAADAIREELAAAGLVVEDTPQGPRWKPTGAVPAG